MITLDQDGAVWTVTLDRPDKANSLTRAMLTELRDIAVSAGDDADLRTFILTGAGERVFSAGADLDEARSGLATDPVWEAVSGAIAALPCVTIAALNGTLAGGAFGMALACDMRVAVPQARFFYPVAQLGFLPQPSDPGRMVDLMGPARAKLLLLGAQKIDAATALSFGLIDRIVEDAPVVAAARHIAEAATVGDAHVLRRIKAMCAAR